MTAEQLAEAVNKEKANGGASCVKLNGTEGYAWFGAGNVGFGSDGSGWLAAGNIHWTKDGHLFTSGRHESNSQGNRIVIDPQSRSLKMINSKGNVVLNASFYEHEGLETGSDIYSYTYDSEGNILGAMRVMGGRVMLYKGDPEDHTANWLMDIGNIDDKISWNINKKAMPKQGEQIYENQVYLDGNFLKLK